MIEWLRFFGLLNASLWLGACIYHVCGAAPALRSPQVEQMLGPANAPYYATALGQVLDQRFFHFQLVFALIACAHVIAMWLYVGRVPKRSWQILLGTLLAITLLQSFVLQPKLRSTHLSHFSRQVPPAARSAAAKAFRAWHGLSFVLTLLQVAGLCGYYWRVANPSEATRFVSAVKFRS